MIKAWDERVVVKKPTRQERTESGIIIPDTMDDSKQTAQGEVVNCGVGVDYSKLIPGDTIIYPKFSAVEIKHNGEDFYIVHSKEILGVIKNAAE